MKNKQQIQPIDAPFLAMNQCIQIEVFPEEEYADEFYILAPIDINDLYNQN